MSAESDSDCINEFISLSDEGTDYTKWRCILAPVLTQSLLVIHSITQNRLLYKNSSQHQDLMFTYIKSCTRFLFVCFYHRDRIVHFCLSKKLTFGWLHITGPKLLHNVIFLSKTEHLGSLSSTVRRRERDDRDFFICSMLGFEPRTWHVHSECLAAELQPQLWRLLFFFKYLLLLSSIMCVSMGVVDGRGPVRTEVTQPPQSWSYPMAGCE